MQEVVDKSTDKSVDSHKMEKEINLGYARKPGDPYTCAFCYPKTGPILIRGARSLVREYMEDNLEGLYHYRIIEYNAEEATGDWKTTCPELLFFRRYPHVDRSGTSKPRYQLIYQNGDRLELVSTFKRPPHNYIAEFDDFDVLVAA